MKFRLLSLLLSCSLSRCSSVKLRLSSLFLSLSLSRCSSVILRLLSVLFYCSLSRCSEVKLRLLSLFLSCSLSRCSSEQFRLLSLALCRSLSRWAWFACRLLSRFLCLSLSLYSKLEDMINKMSRIAELHGAQPIRKISFSSELISLKFLVVYASRNAGGLLFSRQKLCTHRLPEILHWFACGADGRSVARSVGHVITKFSGMGTFIYPWCSAGALRARSSAIKEGQYRFKRFNPYSSSKVKSEIDAIRNRISDLDK